MTTSNPMPPADIDAMLHDVSNQMARSQLFRRLSANSKNSSPGSRKGIARVVKPLSNGSTPNGVQRRRTTAAHTSRIRPTPTPISDPSQALHRGAPIPAQRINYNGASAARPLTWHPGSYNLHHCSEEFQYDNLLNLQPSMAYQNSWSADFSHCETQPSFNQTASSEAPYLDAAAQSTVPDGFFAYNDNSSSYYPISSYDDPVLFPQQEAQICNSASLYPGFESFDLNQIPYDYASYSTQQTPNVSSNQYSLNPPQYVQNPVYTPLVKQRSKELVGMGLYDGPGRKELSTLNSSPEHISHLLAEPQGKGLKLEETWQPPNEEGDEVEEEGYSTDEAEEDLPPAPLTNEAQPTFVPSYGDLSNQSFFFDGDDPYPNYVPFDQGLQLYQPKMSDPSAQNFMWL
ncbi:MAG: hypothetical protein Q9218_005387 [Villophora microphyllina]